MNSVNVIGRIGKEVEVRYTTNNKAVASLTLAVDDGWGDNKKTYWINCAAWDKKAEVLSKCEKGQQIGISGKLTTRDYEGKNGKVYVTEVLINEITFIGGKKAEQGTAEGFTQQDIDDSELPF